MRDEKSIFLFITSRFPRLRLESQTPQKKKPDDIVASAASAKKGGLEILEHARATRSTSKTREALRKIAFTAEAAS